MSRLKSLRGNAVLERFCRARLQAGTVDSSTCSPKGERFRWLRRVATQPVNPRPTNLLAFFSSRIGSFR